MAQHQSEIEVNNGESTAIIHDCCHTTNKKSLNKG
jgi:hypothetical protein